MTPKRAAAHTSDGALPSLNGVRVDLLVPGLNGHLDRTRTYNDVDTGPAEGFAGGMTAIGLVE